MPSETFSVEFIQERFLQAGQSHVFAFWDQLSASQQKELLNQAQSIDLKALKYLLDAQSKAGSVHAPGAFSPDALAPAPYIALPVLEQGHQDWAEAVRVGEGLLDAGKVAVLTVAGGQGTRLGFDGPKGAFPITPVRQKPIFQLFAEKIRAQAIRYGQPIHWFIMTSVLNHDSTKQFFRDHNNFGLAANRIHFFTQGEMPAVSFDDKILMESPGKIAMSPDGHGGVFRALAQSKALSWMQAEGLDLISLFQVDNPLVKVLDPAFIGFHHIHGSEMSSKMVPKKNPDEKVGLFCLKSDKLSIVEYSDVPQPMQQLRDSDGKLTFRAGNIAVHLLNRTFAERMALQGHLPFHFARKKVSYIDVSGTLLKPLEPNAIKFEQFIFDALPLAKNAIVVEASREDEFSPVKNAVGSDSPETSKQAQSNLFRRWLNAAGESMLKDLNALEVSPLCADTQDAFIDYWQKSSNRPPLKGDIYLE
ncbi:MAG TPA: 2-alkenal reductase [Opitutae bacterium]|nr:2-alkenal reductase [Opitutae bacterium]